MLPFTTPLAFFILGAADVPPNFALPSADEPISAMPELRPDFLAGDKCRDKNLPAAGNSGQQPRFERGPATADMGQYIYAVDRRVDGCSVSLAMNYGIEPRGEMKLSPEEIAKILGRR